MSAPVWFKKMENERASSKTQLSCSEVHFLLANLQKVFKKKGIDIVQGMPLEMWYLTQARNIAVSPLFHCFWHIIRAMNEYNIGMEQVLCADPDTLIDAQAADDMMLYFVHYGSGTDTKPAVRRRGRRAAPAPA